MAIREKLVEEFPAMHMAKDTDLDPIRGRQDFTKLIEEVAKNSPAKPQRKP